MAAVELVPRLCEVAAVVDGVADLMTLLIGPPVVGIGVLLYREYGAFVTPVVAGVLAAAVAVDAIR